MKKVIINEERCKSCGLCMDACPKKIIGAAASRRNTQGYRPAEVKAPSECIGCAFCATVCPDCAITIYEEG
ncbi:MAG: 4Fe-4S dicluster domain-containing protein [Clostridiales bacterium]|nr:4Fe-4S dicluster domain-containing protein [Clostridiales bacterium]